MGTAAFAYLCQQAAEKLIKAVLLDQGGRVPAAPDADQVAADAALIIQWIAKARGDLGKRSD